MRLTTKTYYAVTALLDLALHQCPGPISLKEVSVRQGISLPYLEQLFGRLRREGLVVSSRGRQGGYRLGRCVEEISVAMVADAINEPMDTQHCLASCRRDESCLTHHLWMDLSEHIYSFLDGISLADLVARQELARSAQAQEQHRVVEQELRLVPGGSRLLLETLTP